MKIRPTLAFLAVLAFAAAPASLRAQKLQTGTWTGTVAPPDGDAIPFTFEVSMRGDTTRIVANADLGSFTFYGVKVLADRITFAFDPGDTHVTCVLMLVEPGSYKGECADADGGTGFITMDPPKKE